MKKLKGALLSKTFWFNFVVLLVESVDLLNGKTIPPAVAVSIMTVGNIILRAITKESLEKKSERLVKKEQ